MRVKFFNFQSAQYQKFFPLICISSGIYVLPKQMKLREEGIESRGKKLRKRWKENPQDHGERCQTRAKLQPCRNGKSKAHDFVFRRIILMLNVCVYSERRFAQLR